MSGSPPVKDVLQALEHVLRTLQWTASVTRTVMEAMMRGDRLTDASLADYFAQLHNVDRDRARMQQMLAAWWRMVEDEGAH